MDNLPPNRTVSMQELLQHIRNLYARIAMLERRLGTGYIGIVDPFAPSSIGDIPFPPDSVGDLPLLPNGGFHNLR